MRGTVDGAGIQRGDDAGGAFFPQRIERVVEPGIGAARIGVGGGTPDAGKGGDCIAR